MDTSNHSWNAGDRPSLRVTPSGIQLLAYLDYVTVHHFVALTATDSAVPPEPPAPEAPPERYDDERDVHQDDDDDPYDDNIIPPLPLNGGDDMDDDDDDYGDHSPEED